MTKKLINVIDKIIKESKRDKTLKEFNEKEYKEKFENPINDSMNDYWDKVMLKKDDSKFKRIYLI